MQTAFNDLHLFGKFIAALQFIRVIRNCESLLWWVVCVEFSKLILKASTTLSLHQCPNFMVSVVGQAQLLIHISQQFLPILVGISVEKSNQDEAGTISPCNNE